MGYPYYRECERRKDAKTSLANDWKLNCSLLLTLPIKEKISPPFKHTREKERVHLSIQQMILIMLLQPEDFEPCLVTYELIPKLPPHCCPFSMDCRSWVCDPYLIWIYYFMFGNPWWMPSCNCLYVLCYATWVPLPFFYKGSGFVPHPQVQTQRDLFIECYYTLS